MKTPPPWRTPRVMEPSAKRSLGNVRRRQKRRTRLTEQGQVKKALNLLFRTTKQRREGLTLSRLISLISKKVYRFGGKKLKKLILFLRLQGFLEERHDRFRIPAEYAKQDPRILTAAALAKIAVPVTAVLICD